MTDQLTSDPPTEVRDETIVIEVPRRGGWARRLLNESERFALVGLLLAAVLFFSFHPSTSATFFTSANLKVLVTGQVLVCLLAFSMIVTLVAGSFDLSVGANLGLCSIVTAAAMSRFDVPLAGAVAIAICVGALVGAVNAVAVAVLKLNSFIITLGTATVISGLLTWYTEGIAITSGISGTLRRFGSESLFGIPKAGILVIGIGVVVWYLLGHTPFGRHLHAIGSNARAAQLVGIRVDRVKFWSHIIGGVIAGIGGVVAVANLGGASPTTGPDLLFPAFAAVFLGTTCIKPGQFNVPGTAIGVFFVAACVSGLTQMGVKAWVSPVFNGVALIVAVFIASRLARLRRAEAS